MHYLAHYRQYLAALAEQNLLREPRICPPDFSDFASNDYLGWAHTLTGDVRARVGAGASRLVSGTHALHEEAEQVLSNYLEQERSLLFTSAYAANVGVLQALSSVGPGVEIYSDALNHASIIDGCRLAKNLGAVVTTFAHNDATDLATHLERTRDRTKPAFVVVESLFSMDGDRPDLPGLRTLCDRFDAALIVDHAHALGLEPWLPSVHAYADIVVTGFGKAFGLWGGAVSGPKEMIALFENRARSYVFSTGTAPIHAAWLIERLFAVQGFEGEHRKQKLRANQERLVALLQQSGLPLLATTDSHSPILPVLFGSETAALHAAQRFAEANVFVPAIRPPTVPKGTSRLRFTASTAHSDADFARLEHALSSLRRV